MSFLPAGTHISSTSDSVEPQSHEVLLLASADFEKDMTASSERETKRSFKLLNLIEWAPGCDRGTQCQLLLYSNGRGLLRGVFFICIANSGRPRSTCRAQ
jgi:hypothetical protein